MDFLCKDFAPCMVGTWAWGTGSNGSRIVFGKAYKEEQLEDTFETAYNAGFRLWDTAEVYGMGRAERVLGKFIQDKSDVIISTKYHDTRVKRSYFSCSHEKV